LLEGAPVALPDDPPEFAEEDDARPVLRGAFDVPPIVVPPVAELLGFDAVPLTVADFD
jgi:hypothetical protein